MNMKRNILKLIILIIVLVLNYSSLYAQMIPSTGEINKSDTSLVSIPIKYIKLANIKLLERNYLLEVNEVKDSIILNYKDYIKEQEKINSELNKKIIEDTRINNELNKSLQKQKKTSLVLGGIAGASIITILLISIIN